MALLPVLALLASCSGGQLSLVPDEKKLAPDEVRLGATGLPSREDLMKPGPLGELALGKADAPVVVIEYMSLTCPHCRAFHQKTYPKFKREFIDTGKCATSCGRRRLAAQPATRQSSAAAATRSAASS